MSSLLSLLVRSTVSLSFIGILGLSACGGDSELIGGGGTTMLSRTVTASGLDSHRGDRSGSTYGFPSFRDFIGEIHGIYGPSCTLHANAKWSIQFSASAPMRPDLALAPPPELLRNEQILGCPLILTSVRLYGGIGGSPGKTLTLSTPLPLTRTYPMNPVAVEQRTGEGAIFYVNARLSKLDTPPSPAQLDTYYDDPIVVLSYSKQSDPCVSPAIAIAYSTLKATERGSSLPAPNYVLKWDTLDLQLDKDYVIQGTSSGDVAVTLPASSPQPGEEWRLLASLPDDGPGTLFTYEYIAKWYKTLTPVASGSISGSSDILFHWDKLAAPGKTVYENGNPLLIIQHSGTSGAPSYEWISLRFLPPLL